MAQVHKGRNKKSPKPEHAPEVKRRGNFRRLIHNIKQEPIIKSISIHHDCVRVRTVDGIGETWHRQSGIDKRPLFVLPFDPCKGKKVEIEHQYESSELDDDYNEMKSMFIIRYKDWKVGSFQERRLVVLKLVHRLIIEGYKHLSLKRKDLLDDLERLIDSPIDKHLQNDIFLVVGKYGNNRHPGRKLLIQLAYLSEEILKASWSDPYEIYKAICRLLKGRRDVTRMQLMTEIANQFICPNIYRAIMRRFEIYEQVIYDPYPGIGAKAIAAIIERCHYSCPNDFKEMGKFFGADFTYQREHYDCVWLDYNWCNPGDKLLSDFEYWKTRADIKIVYVPNEFAKRMPKPVYSVRVAFADMTNISEITGSVNYYL